MGGKGNTPSPLIQTLQPPYQDSLSVNPTVCLSVDAMQMIYFLVETDNAQANLCVFSSAVCFHKLVSLPFGFVSHIYNQTLTYVFIFSNDKLPSICWWILVFLL